MGKILVNLSTGAENDDKVAVAFVVANAALAAEQETAIFLSAEAVNFAKQGFAEGHVGQGFNPTAELIANFISGGGMLWVCPPCAKARDITEDNMLEGAVYAGGGKLIEFLASGAQSVSY